MSYDAALCTLLHPKREGKDCQLRVDVFCKQAQKCVSRIKDTFSLHAAL